MELTRADVKLVWLTLLSPGWTATMLCSRLPDLEVADVGKKEEAEGETEDKNIA